MGILSKAFAATAWTSLAGSASWLLLTRQCKVAPIPPTDYIFHHTLFARYNPNNAPVTQDVCTRKVPLGKIRPELLEDGKGEGKLVTAFCQGVWGGLGALYRVAESCALEGEQTD
jgi:hypothetical protein